MQVSSENHCSRSDQMVVDQLLQELWYIELQDEQDRETEHRASEHVELQLQRLKFLVHCQVLWDPVSRTLATFEDISVQLHQYLAQPIPSFVASTYTPSRYHSMIRLPTQEVVPSNTRESICSVLLEDCLVAGGPFEHEIVSED